MTERGHPKMASFVFSRNGSGMRLRKKVPITPFIHGTLQALFTRFLRYALPSYTCVGKWGKQAMA